MCFVGGDGFDAERGTPVVVPAGHEVGGFVARDERGQHVGEATHGVVGHTVDGAALRYAVERAEVQAGRIEEQKTP